MVTNVSEERLASILSVGHKLMCPIRFYFVMIFLDSPLFSKVMTVKHSKYVVACFVTETSLIDLYRYKIRIEWNDSVGLVMGCLLWERVLNLTFFNGENLMLNDTSLCWSVYIRGDRKFVQPIPDTCSICRNLNYIEIRRRCCIKCWKCSPCSAIPAFTLFLMFDVTRWRVSAVTVFVWHSTIGKCIPKLILASWVRTRCQVVFDNEHTLHLWKNPCTSTVERKLTVWREQVTTWRDRRRLLCSHSDIVFNNPIELYWIATIYRYFNMRCVTFRLLYWWDIPISLEVTEYFIHHLSEADWLTRARDSRCAEESKTQPPSFVSATLVPIQNAR
jgi:hypothetical protein